MDTTMETSLRQSNSNVKVEGVLNEISLEQSKTKTGDDCIKGYLAIKTSETCVVNIRVYAQKTTTQGIPSKTYPAIETIMNNYHSVADVGEEADIVHCNGTISTYTDPDTRKTSIGYSSNFFSRVKREPAPKAEFSVELFVETIIPETINEEETGRIKVKGWMPTYNGIEPVEVIGNKDLADDLVDYLEPQGTYEFWGNIISTQKVEKKIKAAGIGAAKEDIRVTYKNELVLTGVSEKYEQGITPVAPYDPDAIRLAKKERETKLSQKNSEGNKPKPTAQGTGRTLTW